MENPQSPNNWGYTIDEDPNQGVITDDEEIQKYVSKQIDENKKAELKNQADETTQEMPSFYEGATFYADEDAKPAHSSINQDDPVKDEIDSFNAFINDNFAETDDALEDLPSREKIDHPVHLDAEKKMGALAREETIKDTDINHDERRKFKESNKYIRNYTNPEKEYVNEFKTNLPMLETIDEVKPAIRTREQIRNASEKRINNAFERAATKLNEGFEEYYMEGAIDSFSHGDLSFPNPRKYLEDGFKDAETKSINGMLAGNREKDRFWREFTYDVIDEKANEWEKAHNAIDAERDIIREAVSRGAYLEGAGKTELHTTLPIFEQEDGILQNYMEKYNSSVEDKDIQLASYDGFANIIAKIVEQESNTKEATRLRSRREINNLTRVQDDDKDSLPELASNEMDMNERISGKATEEGFKALDWYFENFQYGEHIQNFLDSMEEYIETREPGREWVEKYEEYLEQNSTILKKFEKDQKEKPLPTLEGSEEIDGDAIFDKWGEVGENDFPNPTIQNSDAIMGALQRIGIPEIFKDKVSWNKGGISVNMGGNNQPASLPKFYGALKNFVKIKNSHPNAKFELAMFKDNYQGYIAHAVISYRKNNSSVALVVPIRAKCYSATYAWVADYPKYQPSDWEKVFSFDPNNPNAVVSKYDVSQRNDIERHSHKSAIPTKGLDEVDNMWDNTYKDVDKRA